MIRLCLVGGLALAGDGRSAEGTPPAAAGTPRAVRLLSPRLQAALDASLPGYAPVAPVTHEGVGAGARTNADVADVEVFSLPEFVVRGTRPVRLPDLLTPEGKLERFLGPRDGFDRGVLNRVTLRWGRGFVQFSLFGALRNESRAAIMQADEQRLRGRESLRDLASRLKDVGDAEAGARLERASADLLPR